MKPMNKCQICGKTVRGSLLCEQCEGEVLETHKVRRYIFSGLAGLVILGALYFLFREYQEKQSMIDPTIVTGAYQNFLISVRGIMASPYLFVPTVVIFIILAFLIGVKLSK